MLTQAALALLLAVSADAGTFSEKALHKSVVDHFDSLNKNVNKKVAAAAAIKKNQLHGRNLGKRKNGVSYLVSERYNPVWQSSASTCGITGITGKEAPAERVAMVFSNNTDCYNNLDGSSQRIVGCKRDTTVGGSSIFYEIDSYQQPDCRSARTEVDVAIHGFCSAKYEGDSPTESLEYYQSQECSYKYPFKDEPGALFEEYSDSEGCMSNHNPNFFMHFGLKKCHGMHGDFHVLKCEKNVGKALFYEEDSGCTGPINEHFKDRLYPSSYENCHDEDEGELRPHSWKCSNNHLYYERDREQDFEPPSTGVVPGYEDYVPSLPTWFPSFDVSYVPYTLFDNITGSGQGSPLSLPVNLDGWNSNYRLNITVQMPTSWAEVGAWDGLLGNPFGGHPYPYFSKDKGFMMERQNGPHPYYTNFGTLDPGCFCSQCAVTTANTQQNVQQTISIEHWMEGIMHCYQMKVDANCCSAGCQTSYCYPYQYDRPALYAGAGYKPDHEVFSGDVFKVTFESQQDYRTQCDADFPRYDECIY